MWGKFYNECNVVLVEFYIFKVVIVFYEVKCLSNIYLMCIV